MAGKKSLRNVIFYELEINSTTILKSNFLLSANLQGAIPWTHIQCKSLVERCSDNPKLCVLFQGFWFLYPTYVSRDFGARRPKTTVFSKTAVFSRDLGLPQLLYFPGISVCCGTKTAVFLRGFSLLWNQNCCLFQGFWSSWNQNDCIFQGFWYTAARSERTCLRNFLL